MGKASKATKKFQKNHLGRELTKRKHDQKKKQIREKSLSKYAPKEGEGSDGEDGEEAEESQHRDETDVFSTKAKSKPLSSSSSSRPSSAKHQPAAKGVYVKPAARKAPSIEDLDVDQFMDGGFLEDGGDGDELDDGGLDDDDDDDVDDEDEDASMDGDENGEDDSEEANAALLADIEAHEAELANLANIDPEFYSHLKEHDKELLKFNKQEFDRDEADDDEDRAALSDDEDDGSGGKDGQKLEVLTMTKLKDLQRQVKGMSIKALKRLVRTFRSAIHIGTVGDARSKEAGGKKIAQSEENARKEALFRQDIEIHDPKVFSELVRFVLAKDGGLGVWEKQFHSAGEKKDGATATSSSTPSTAQNLSSHPRWNTVGPVLKAFLGHLLFFLGTLKGTNEDTKEEDSSQAKMARFVLGGLEGLIRFFAPFPKLSGKLLKELLDLWSTSEKIVRIDAFLRIRQLSIELTAVNAGKQGENMLELTLKGIYLTYVKSTKFTSALTLPVIEFMANCVVEIYGIDPVLSYQHAFVYIRQLAIHLRQALQVKKKDSHRQVYNWNYINCLRVWSKVLARHGKESTSSQGLNGQVAAQDSLHALIYPFVQLGLGTLNVLSSSRYFPLRFHVCRFLIELCEQTKIFIPLAPFLLAVFNAPELKKKPSASTRKVSEIGHILKASKHVIQTKTYQEAIVTEALGLLLEYFGVFAYSIAFNELILPTVKLLKKISKDLLIHRVRKQIQQFILKLEHNASWISGKRASSNYAPKDMQEKKNGGVDAIDSFRLQEGEKGQKNQVAPLDKYVSQWREEKKLLDETKADWNGSKTPKVGKKGKDSDDEDDDDEDEHQRNKKRGGDDEDEEMEEDGEDEEGEDEDEDDDEGDDDDEQPRKKSKSNTAASIPRKPFEYPSGVDDEDGHADQLDVMTFSDDEDEVNTNKNKKGKKRNANGTKTEKKNQNKSNTNTSSNKKPTQKSGDKRKRV